MENGNAKQSAVIFTESISEFIITHDHPARLPPRAGGVFVVSRIVRYFKC